MLLILFDTSIHLLLGKFTALGYLLVDNIAMFHFFWETIGNINKKIKK